MDIVIDCKYWSVSLDLCTVYGDQKCKGTRCKDYDYDVENSEEWYRDFYDVEKK